MHAPRTSVSNPRGMFVTKHSAACTWTFLDDDSVTLLGHFPHELVGSEVFEIIHPQDLNILMESFESLVLGKSSPYKSYRIRTRNGDYVTITSTWSSFLNPWTRQLEFIQGNHALVKGPKHPDIFSDTLMEQEEALSEEIVKVQNLIIGDIKLLMNNYARKKHIYDVTSGGSITERKKLTKFMGNLLQEVAKAENFGSSFQGVSVAGNISVLQSDSSSLPSYNQMTWKENLNRFFRSQPKTSSEQDNSAAAGAEYSSPSSYEDNPNGNFRPLKSKREQSAEKFRYYLFLSHNRYLEFEQDKNST